MIRVIPILLAIAYALAMYRFSAWRTSRELNEKSTRLADPALTEISGRLARALDLSLIHI